MKAILADMRATAQAHEQWAQSAEASSSEAATSTVFATQIRAWIESLDKLAEALTACQQERDEAQEALQEPHAQHLAAYLLFIRGKDIPQAEEKARAVLIERALRAEADLTACRAQGEAMRAQLAQEEGPATKRLREKFKQMKADGLKDIKF